MWLQITEFELAIVKTALMKYFPEGGSESVYPTRNSLTARKYATREDIEPMWMRFEELLDEQLERN